jgi:ABC-type multidrug transport system fused ATPase/permease subunit
MLLGAVVSVVGGLAVAFTGSWKVTLVMLAFMPLLFVGGFFSSRILNINQSGEATKEGDSIASAGQVSFSSKVA